GPGRGPPDHRVGPGPDRGRAAAGADRAAYRGGNPGDRAGQPDRGRVAHRRGAAEPDGGQVPRRARGVQPVRRVTGPRAVTEPVRVESPEYDRGGDERAGSE